MNEAHSLVKNHEALTARFGRWPSFHDAEVVSLQCQRSGPIIELTMHVWNMSKEIDDHGYFVRTNESMVRLEFTRIRDLELEGFNEQNVLGELTLEAKPNGLRITLWSQHGLGGSFMCDSAEVVDVSPLGA